MIVMGRSPDIFEYPDTFIPERWNREEHVRYTFAHVPFGFGPRMCIGELFCVYIYTTCISSEDTFIIISVGRRVAELNLHITLAHIIKQFVLEYPDKKPMNTKMTLLLKPERILNIVLKNL